MNDVLGTDATEDLAWAQPSSKSRDWRRLNYRYADARKQGTPHAAARAAELDAEADGRVPAFRVRRPGVERRTGRRSDTEAVGRASARPLALASKSCFIAWRSRGWRQTTRC